jgi:hypothetical protein
MQQIPQETQIQIDRNGATNRNGWVSGVFEGAILVILLLLVSMPVWLKKLTRRSGPR